MKDFRLTIFVQIAVLSGLARGGSNVLSKAYPVKGRGSYNHLVETGIKEEDIENALHQLAMELGIDRERGDFPECICCESRVDRQHVRDVLFKGMDLFHLMWCHNDKKYRPFVKRYGTDYWVSVFETCA